MNLACGIDQSIPLNLRHEAPDKVWVEVGLPYDYLDILELEREVI